MRIAYALPQLPFPPHSGGRLVTYNLIRQIAQRHEVFVFGLSHGDDEETRAGIEHLGVFCRSVKAFPAAARMSLRTIARMAVSSLPYKVLRFHSPAMMEALRRCEREHDVEILHCQNFYTAQYAHHSPSPVRVLYEENFEPSILDRRIDRTRNTFLNTFLRHERRRTVKYQVASIGWLDAVDLISRLDAGKLTQAVLQSGQEALAPRIHAIPTGIDTTSYQRPANPQPPPNWDRHVPNLVFTGAMNYVANEDAAEWFCSQIWPGVIGRNPQARLWLVGHSPSARVQALARLPNVTVTGAVSDVRPYLWQATVFVIPLQIGGGIRLKLLEALSASCPVVSTKVGAEGLALDESFPWLEAESAQVFQDQVLRLIEEPSRRETLAAEGMAWVRRHYDAAAFGDRMEAQYDYLRSVAAGSSSTLRSFTSSSLGS